MLEELAPSQKMPVCVDGRLAASETTGVASYAAAMRAALAATGAPPLVLDDARRGQFGGPVSVYERWRRQVQAWIGGRVRLRRDGDRFHARDIFRLAQVRFATSGRLLQLAVPGPAGIMHWTYPIPARIAGWVNIYTVHDVIPLVTPELSLVDPEQLLRRIMAISGSADRIITVSESARQAILANLPLDEGLVVNAGAAVAGVEPAGAPLPEGLVRDGYYLFCGIAEPRKNVPRLIDAWAASGTSRPLVLVGPDHGGAPARPGIVSLPYQKRGVVMDLIHQARALLFPSLAEGFGLPVIEAMALGTPVLTSGRGALAETAGDAALLVDPTDIGDIALGIARLDQDAALHADLSRRGLVRAMAFSAPAFGQRLRRLHDEFAGDSRLAG